MQKRGLRRESGTPSSERNTKKSQCRRRRNILCLLCQICLVIQFVAFFYFCAQKPGEKDFSLKKELEIGLLEGDKDYIFGQITDVKIDSLGNIFILDVKMNRVVKYDRDGKFIVRFGEKGAGPGEFEDPRSIALDSSGRVYVLDFHKVIIFDEAGGLLKSFGLDFMGIDMALNDKGNILILGARDNQLFNVYDREGKYLYSFGDLVNSPKEFAGLKGARLFRTPLRLWANRNKIFVMNPYKYEIWLYEDEKLKGRLTRRSPDYLKPELREDVPGGFSAVVSGNFIFEENNTIYVYYDGEKASWLDVFEDGKLIISKKVKGILSAIDDKGKFYFIESEEYSKICRYFKNKGL